MAATIWDASVPIRTLFTCYLPLPKGAPTAPELIAKHTDRHLRQFGV